MPFIVETTRTPKGKFVVDPCPSCEKRHVHGVAGVVIASCGMRYYIIEPAPRVRGGRR